MNKLTRNIYQASGLCEFAWNSDISYCFNSCWQSTFSMISKTYDSNRITNDGLYHDISMCTHKWCYCFPCNILLRCHRRTEQTVPGLAQAKSHLSLTVETQVQAVDEVTLGWVFLQLLWLYSKSFHQCSTQMFHLLTICVIQTYQ